MHMPYFDGASTNSSLGWLFLIPLSM